MKRNGSETSGAGRVQRVAIIGAGPAGCTLAAFLADAGVEVTLFETGDRPELVVGESTLPAMVSTLRRLGIEEQVASTSVLKPGACFVFRDQRFVQLCFSQVEGTLPTYAYNVNRKVFDELLSVRAEEAGAHRVCHRAGIKVEEGDRLALDAESLAAAGGDYAKGRQPDLLIDATGRSRLFARALEIPTALGARKDVSYFAHFEGYEEEIEPRGQAVITLLESGWSWQIPLPEQRMSIGIVVDRKAAKRLGATAEERLESVIRDEPNLSRNASRARRVTPVMTYTNYQLISERGSGANWFTLGDAFGFVDPMLSPGLFVAVKSAEELADGLLALREGETSLEEVGRSHESGMAEQLKAWGEYVERYYNGEMFAMQRAGQVFVERFNFWPNRMISRFIERQVATMAAGGTVTRPFNRRLIGLLCRLMAQGEVRASVAIR